MKLTEYERCNLRQRRINKIINLRPRHLDKILQDEIERFTKLDRLISSETTRLEIEHNLNSFVEEKYLKDPKYHWLKDAKISVSLIDHELYIKHNITNNHPQEG